MKNSPESSDPNTHPVSRAPGRPRFLIDYRLAACLGGIHCTVEEIAAVLGCSKRTLERDAEFCRIHKKGLDEGRIALRRLQWEAAKQGNVTILIWLGKQYLGQRDRHEIGGEGGGAIKHTIKIEFVGAANTDIHPFTPHAGNNV